MNKAETEMIARYLNGACSREEKAKVEAWLQRASNRRAFAELKQIWEATEHVYARYTPDHAAGWNRVEQATGKNAGAFAAWKWIGRAAAVLLVAVSAVWLTGKLAGDNQRAAANLIEVVAGAEVDSVRLSDGTVVWLNRDSRLLYPETFAGAERKAQLSGEAFFEVAKDAARPFIVESEGAVTRVLGTSFNLRTSDRTAAIEVVSGKVSFGGPGDEANAVELTRGERAEYDRRAGRVEKSLISDPNFLSWKTGVLIFENTALPEVVATLNKHYDAAIRLSFSDSEPLSLTATFDRQNLEEALQVICLTLDLHFEKTPGGYLLTK